MKRGREDSGQLFIDWTPTPQGGNAGSNELRPALPSNAVPLRPSPPPPIRLSWDFSTTFPEPTEYALDAGILDPSDFRPENVKALHEQHSNDALAILQAIDRANQAKAAGADPRNGKRPRSHAGREKLRRSLEGEPERLERSFQVAMGAYANVFGEEASDVFAQYLRARHADIPVTGEPTPPAPEARKPRAIMPVPKPMECAVEKGNFGENDDGPIRPSPDEVYMITKRLAENLIDWMAALQEVEKVLRAPVCSDRARLYREKDQLAGKIGGGLAMYAEDFGPQAAAQLRAYASHQTGTGRER